ncbi:zinc finger protein 85 [Anabrus simplex]|uniref:zinc finger protein 85 n=1 Tax=Anabrus simplex TaxID=316456 RepID=UPI0035A2C969
MAEDIRTITFKCSACKFLCESEGDFFDHLKSHGISPLSCLACHVKFSNNYLFDYHKSSNMCRVPVSSEVKRLEACTECLKSPDKCLQCNKNKKLEQCAQCGKTFRIHRQYVKHMESHKRNNCSYCNAPLTSRKELALHMAEKHLVKFREAVHQCKFCNKCFVKRVTLYSHYNQHANGQFVCLSCGMFLKTEEEYTSHKEKHDREKRWRCELCKEHFSRRQQYLIHMKGHEKYQCTICGENFAVKIKLMEHEREVHLLRRIEKRHVCSTCGQCFSRPNLLELHYRIHTGEKPFLCKPCDKSFRSTNAYFKHLRTLQHRSYQATAPPVKVYSCDICDKSFNQKTILEKHKTRVHGKGETFSCDFCSHKSNCKENMKRHLALHTEKRRFVCEQCGAAFHALQALKDHGKYVHSQTRHFTCAQCGKSFKINSDLNRHMASHSEVRPHVCDCGRSYKRASHLRRHKESVHGIVIKPPKLLRVSQDESGALVSVVDEYNEPSKIKKRYNSREQNWQASQEKENAVNSVISMVGTDACHPPPTSNELTSVIHCADEAQRDSFAGGVMHTIEVSYDINSFTTPEPLTAVPSTESQLVFSTPISVALDQTHAVLSLHSDPMQNTHNTDHIERVHLDPLLHTTNHMKHSDDIYIHQGKHESAGPVLLGSSVTSHVAMDSSSSLYISSEALNGSSALMTTSSEASLMSDLHHSTALLSLSSDTSSHRYAVTNSLQDNVGDCNSFLQPIENARHKMPTTLSTQTLDKCIEPNDIDSNTTNLPVLPDYLPQHYPFLNV